MWALFRELGRGCPLTDRSRSVTSSRVHSWVSLARSTARFTRPSRASQSSWQDGRVGSRYRRPCSMDSSWADAGEQLTL